MISNQSTEALYTDPPPGFKVVYNFEERILLIMERGSKQIHHESGFQSDRHVDCDITLMYITLSSVLLNELRGTSVWMCAFRAVDGDI